MKYRYYRRIYRGCIPRILIDDVKIVVENIDIHMSNRIPFITLYKPLPEHRIYGFLTAHTISTAGLNILLNISKLGSYYLNLTTVLWERVRFKLPSYTSIYFLSTIL